MRFVVLTLLVCTGWAAQNEQFAPAVAGYAGGGNAGLRVITGSAGAAQQVNQAPLPNGAAVNARLGYALAWAGEAWRLLPDDRPLPAGIPQDAAVIAWSPRGTSALLHSPGNEQVIVVSGLPGTPVIRQRIDVFEPFTAAAVTDSGSRVAFATAKGVFRASGGEDLPWLAWSGKAVAVAFVPASADLLIGDAAGRAVWKATAGSRQIVASGLPEGLVAVAQGADGTLVTAHANGLVRIERPAAQPVTVECRCRPTQLDPMATAGSWLLTNEKNSSDPLWMVEASGAEPRTAFIPARAEVQE